MDSLGNTHACAHTHICAKINVESSLLPKNLHTRGNLKVLNKITIPCTLLLEYFLLPYLQLPSFNSKHPLNTTVPLLWNLLAYP